MTRALAFAVAAAIAAGAAGPASAKDATRIDPSFVAAAPSPALREIAARAAGRSIALGEVVVAPAFPGSEADLRAALRKSLAAFGLNARSARAARYVLSASAYAFDMDDRPAAKSTTALVDIGYRIQDRATGEILFEQTFETGFTARAPRKGKAPDARLALAKARTRAELAAMMKAAELNPAPASSFESVRCAPKGAAGPVGDGELADAARRRCAANHAVRANLSAVFSRLLAAAGEAR
ncbi:MAG: hypothetical protein GC153_08700 [Alphaproteobacteria bacterium]|nr:hypothetical protein [Alphaproteobacteria bacterium]